MELYNNGRVSKHLSLVCCMNHNRVGVLSLSLFVLVYVCVCLCAFDFFEPDQHEQFLYTPLQNKLRIKLDTETFPKSFLLGDLDRRNIPMSFSS
jgi:hypothetical protein